MTVLSVRALGVPFGAGPGLRDVTFDVAAGERFVVLGASGAGKTSLLRSIAGLHPVTGGTIAIHGHDVTGSAAERRDAVYLHQTPVLFPHLTVYENVAFPLRVRNVTDVDHRVRAALAAVQMTGFAPRLPRTLSGGQAQRVALARAVVARPAVLLLDEPLSSLDPILRDDIRRTILDLQAEWNGAVVIVTHDLDDATALADRVAVLLDRQIAQVASPAELIARPASLAVARFLGHLNELPEGDVVAVFPPSAVRLDPDGLRARVAALRYRVRGTTAVLTVGDARVEMLIDPHEAPAVGAELRVTIDRRGVVLFQNVETPSVATSSTRIVS
jgi:putative spermidine/putrescine transport system ATP-binding protein